MIRKNNPTKSNSIFDGLSVVEMFIIILIPVVLTGIGFVISNDVFGFNWLITLSMSVVFTISIVGLVILIVNFFMERYT